MNEEVAAKVRTFFEKYPLREFSRQQIIIQAGEEPTGVFYLVEGRVSQYDISLSGAEAVVNVFQSPAFFPMSWAMNKTSNQYFFEASTAVVARQAPPGEVIEFLRSEPDVMYDLLSRVYRGTDGLLRRLAHLMVGNAKGRLVFEILNASRRFGKENKAGSLRVPLKEGDLAKHSGLARETVNRIIQGLKADGLVEVTKDGLVVPDVSLLEAEIGSDL